MSFNSGDNVGAIVADIGSFASRIGFAGDDMPKAYFSSNVGMTYDESDKMDEGGIQSTKNNYHFDLVNYRDDMSIGNPIKDGLITDWDMLERVWEHAITNYLKVDIKETPLLIAEKPYNPVSNRYKMAELLFEKFSVPAMFTSKDAVLECYACGRTSGLVIDIGSSGTVITPVSDGFVDTRGLNRSIVGGRYLDDFTLSLIKRRLGSNPVQKFKINRVFNQERVLVVKPAIGLNSINPSYESLMNLELGRDVKETISRIAESTLFEADSRFASIPMIPYELPDGTVIDFGLERYQIAECLFDPSAIDLENIDMVTLGLNASKILPASTLEGIPRLVSDSVLRCEPDLQSTLLSNLVIAGGGSSVEGLVERIKAEVENVVHASSPGLKVKAISAGVNERAICAWLGGSILASLGSFHEMWYTKQEYEEFGSSLLDRKCP